MKKREKAIKILDLYKMPYTLSEPDSDTPTWDGKVLYLSRIKTTDYILHDLAHWIVATPKERKLPNYGTGPSPDDLVWSIPKDKRISDKLSNKKEILSANLGVLLYAYYISRSLSDLDKVIDGVCLWNSSVKENLLTFKELKKLGYCDFIESDLQVKPIKSVDKLIKLILKRIYELE